jgi:hypothetical protein
MDSFETLSGKMVRYQKAKNFVVGQISFDRLTSFYNLLEKAVKICTELNDKGLNLTGFIEGDTQVGFDGIKFYRGPCTIIQYIKGSFQIDRCEAVKRKNTGYYPGGLLRVEIITKNIESLLVFISEFSRKANIKIGIPEVKRTDGAYHLMIFKKDLIDIAKAELSIDL